MKTKKRTKTVNMFCKVLINPVWLETWKPLLCLIKSQSRLETAT